jgi:15-cis-phytoene synthase
MNTTTTTGWQYQLIEMAHEALESSVNENCLSSYDPAVVEEAYQYCRMVTKENSHTFYLAANLMPADRRKAVFALYAFCRVCDDLVDKKKGDTRRQLARWRSRLSDCIQTGEDAVAIGWADTRYRFQIPWRYADQLIQGLSQDLVQTRYHSFPELAAYCYGAASTVGLMSMHIVGYSGPQAIPYAVRLGVALQLTNILRDVGEDQRIGRIYLPLDELEAFGLSEQDVAAGKVTEKWREFMRFQIRRVRQLYSEALPGVSHLDLGGRFSIAAAAENYQLILNRIEDNDYDVFSHRAAVSTWGKIRSLPGIWYRSRFNRYPQSQPGFTGSEMTPPELS